MSIDICYDVILIEYW